MTLQRWNRPRQRIRRSATTTSSICLPNMNRAQLIMYCAIIQLCFLSASLGFTPNSWKEHHQHHHPTIKRNYHPRAMPNPFTATRSIHTEFQLPVLQASANQPNNDLLGNEGPFASSSLAGIANKKNDTESTGPAQKNEPVEEPSSVSRRSSLQRMMFAAATTATVAATTTAMPLAASAGKPEVDSYGNLYTPKSEMLTGGSQAARGIATRDRGKRLKPGQALQSVYETRFIAYLSRFLLNFDPAANAWWRKNGGESEFTWESLEGSDSSSSADANMAQYKFAEFAESVEVGLADYFVGPYGSYSSVQAAKAGLLASAPAVSSQPQTTKKSNKLIPNVLAPKKSDKKGDNNKSSERNGVLNLYSLLKARYTSIAAKRQLAILFSFISSPYLQPTKEIKGLLGEADNATITKIKLIRQPVKNEAISRTSSRRGGGYSKSAPPLVVAEAPPALGDDYLPAQFKPIMKPTSRVLRIQVLDCGEGYTSAPQVTVVATFSGGLVQRMCQACAIIDRRGHILEVVVLDPGYGYGGRGEVPPKVFIAPPKEKPGNGGKKTGRQAKAVADLEYEVVGIDLVRGGNGFVKKDPPNVHITPPLEDPDWFLAAQEQPEMRMIPVKYIEPIRAEVAEMKNEVGNVVYPTDGMRQIPPINKSLIQRLERDPLELLPSNVELELDRLDEDESPIYRVTSLPPVPPYMKPPSPRYRAFDPVFGGVGSVPVTKGAVSLTSSEYGRLALSGAVCTVLVRTALNPLELIKTKQQLDNDKELFEYARNKIMRKKSPDTSSGNGAVEPNGSNGSQSYPSSSPTRSPPRGSASASSATTSATAETTAVMTPTATATNNTEAPLQKEQGKLGVLDLIFSLMELRGPLALFQSADITFLASLVFGSFGFGATELFRRSFSEFFFSDGGGSSGGGSSEVVLLGAAALATIITSAAATPFEVLRVKSMILLEPAKWTAVLQKFIDENGSQGNSKNGAVAAEKEFRFSELQPKDLLPLWAGFAPTLSRELPFAIAKFLAFDILSHFVIDLINAQTQEGALPIQVGVGPTGLAVSAIAGAVAGIAGAIVSHPADLILTYTSASKSKTTKDASGEVSQQEPPGWIGVVKELVSRDGGVTNLFLGLPARATFFFLVIGLQFFLYDYVKGLFQVGTDDLSLVLDVFYAVRAGLVDMDVVK